MKKLFTLMAATALVALSGNAKLADPSTLEFKGVAPAYQHMMQNKHVSLAELYNTEEGKKKVSHRTWEQGNYIYDTYIMRMGKLTDVIILSGENGEVMTHDQYPFHVVVFQTLRASRTTPDQPNTSITAFTTWPSYRTWKNMNDVDDMSLSTDMVTLEDFMENPNTSKTFRWNNFSNAVTNFLPSVNDSQDVVYFPIWSNVMDEKQMYNGVEGLTFVTEGARSTQFTLQDIDFDSAVAGSPVDVEMFTTMAFDYYFSNTQSCSGIYNGMATYSQFDPVDFNLDFQNVHIFNAGAYNQDNTDIYDISYNGIYQPWSCEGVQKYYLWALNNYANIGFTSTSSTIPFDMDKVQVTYASQDDIYKIFYLRGSLFSKEGTQKPTEQQWTLTRPKTFTDEEYDMDFLGINPTPQSMVPGGYDDTFYYWTTIDGIEACCNGYLFYPNLSLGLAVGTEEGIILEGMDEGDNTYTTTPYMGKIIYHYDPKNMRNTEEIDAVGTYVPSSVESVAAEEGAKISAVNGEITVVCNNNANVAVYTLDGQVVANKAVKAGETMTVNGANGLYIVKVGKTACKVAL